MKIYVDSPYYNGEGDSCNCYRYSITIEDEYDVEVISQIIKAGDFISLDSYFWTFVINANFINGPLKTIQIDGSKYGDIVETISIGANTKIEIHIEQEEVDRVEKMNKMIKNLEIYEMYKKSISSDHIQNEGFRILQQYINKKPYKVIYGNDVISSMNKELVKVVFVCWNFIKTQDIKIVNLLTQNNHKNNKTNIIVVWKGNENYNELKNYGGIVGVLF